MSENLELEKPARPAPAAGPSSRAKPTPLTAVDAQQMLEQRVSVIKEGDSVMLRLPSDVIRVVTIQKQGYVRPWS